MNSTFFPPAADTAVDTGAALDYDTEEEQEGGQGTEAMTEILSQLPDAPTNEPVDVDHAKQPSQKKQKTDEASDDGFVVVDKEELNESDKAKPRGEL